MLVKGMGLEKRAEVSKNIFEKYCPDLSGGGKGRKIQEDSWSLVQENR